MQLFQMFDLYHLKLLNIPEPERSAHSEFDIFGKIEQFSMIVNLYLIGTPERTGTEIRLREAIQQSRVGLKFALVFDSRLNDIESKV